MLSAKDASALLTEAGVTLARERLAGDPQAAAAAATEFGFPVVLKLMSPDIPHKTDHGLVKLGVGSAEEAARVAADLLDRGRALAGASRVDGVLVQEQVQGGVEMIIGLTIDPQLGPALTIGAGGVYAEVLKDVATAPLPVNARDIREMIASLRLAPLLDGVRGAPAADKEGLVDLALRIAALGLAARGRLVELDLNPVLVQPNRVVAVDALVVAQTPPPPAAAAPAA
jgi:acyl-CoA synthetase (NDP forming)